MAKGVTLTLPKGSPNTFVKGDDEVRGPSSAAVVPAPSPLPPSGSNTKRRKPWNPSIKTPRLKYIPKCIIDGVGGRFGKRLGSAPSRGGGTSADPEASWGLGRGEGNQSVSNFEMVTQEMSNLSTDNIDSR
jgi:hypothetical protein